jgi:branched-chain amino acid transport system ATP-binding protein
VEGPEGNPVTPILRCEQITKHFGGLKVLEHIDLDVHAGEILALIGPNGAGKTTFFNVLTGYVRPTSGRVLFDGQDITGAPPDVIASLGMVRTFQASIMFDRMTVGQSMLTAHHLGGRGSVWSALFNRPAYRQREAAIERGSIELLEFMGLVDMKDELVANLPHGRQRALGVAMAMATRPRLLLLDEPVTGMNPEELVVLMRQIHDLRDLKQQTIVIIEHHMAAVMEFSDRITVLNFGRKIAEGTPTEIGTNPDVIAAYLGAPVASAAAEVPHA